MTHLQFLNGPRAGEVLILTEGTWPLGRAADNAVVVADPSVSARHAELLVSGGEVMIQDLHSSNGTHVEERRVANQAPLRAGQSARVGMVEFRITHTSHFNGDDPVDGVALQGPVTDNAGNLARGRSCDQGTTHSTELDTSRSVASVPGPSTVTPQAMPMPLRIGVVVGAMAVAAAIWWVLR